MNEAQRCPQCGGRLTDGSVEGLCPRCLLTAALRQPAETALENLPEPGCQIGAYRIVRLLGEGGMGLVYLAEQEEPITRQVALKIIKLGMDTRAVLGRFHSEQQALALMDHPNIAQVYEAGSNAQGRPYFVMEYVPGIPITQYCDLHRLGTRQRLELFLQVANAVQHAHQKGVIHRDLKPSNVLVMERDGEAVPKIIDFGLAKATEKHLTEESVFTEAGVLIGTPEYMSPEQASLGKVNVDTRTDVYSLGVLLYELLVGAAPFESKLLRSAGYDEIRRIIREDDPPTPAARLLTLGAQVAEIAHCRSTEAGVLRKEVRGELDWITMKALEKDCARRYPSASGMAADIQHYLHDEPVDAGPAGPAYRFRKFMSKNRPAVAAVAVIFLLLASGLGVSSGLLIKIQRQDVLSKVESYAANVAAAELLLRDNQTGAARLRLLACEPTLRKWEWRHLWYRLNSSPVSFSWQLEGAVFPRHGLQIGFPGARICWKTMTTVRCSEGPDYASPAVFRFDRVLGLSNDGALAVTAGDEGIRVVEVASGKSVSACRECQTGMSAIAGRKSGDGYPEPAIFSPDGTRVAVSAGGGTLVWEARSGRTLARLAAGRVLAFSPDGRRVALGKDASLELWDVDPPHRIASLATGGQVSDAVFSPDGTRLASATSKGAVQVWKLKPLSGSTVLAAVGKSVEAMAFSPDGRRLAATGFDGTVRIWLDGQLAASLSLGGGMEAIAFSADGTRLAAGSLSGVLFVWDATPYDDPLLRRAANPYAIAVSPDSTRLAAGFGDGLVELWGMDGTVERGWPAHRQSVSSAAFSPDGKWLVTGSADYTARLWNVSSGTPGIELRGHTAEVTAVAFSPDGARVATGSQDRTARIWDAASGQAIATIKLKDSVNSVVFSPDGADLLVGSGGGESRAPSVGLWNAATGMVLREFWSESCGAGSLCPSPQALFSPDGLRAAAYLSNTKECWVWDVRTGAVAAKLRADGIGPKPVAFDPDGDRIVIGGSFNGLGSAQGAVQIWDAVRYEPLLTLRSDKGIWNLVFTPDGSRLLGLTDAGVRMWDTRTAYPPPERGGVPVK